MIPQRFWTLINFLITALAVFVIVLVIGGFRVIGNIGHDNNNVSTINVEGTAEVVAVPDIATFSFGVTETAKTVAEAQKLATDKINSALKTVRDQGVADKDISTQSYNINPHYDYQSAVCPRSSDTVSYCPGGKSVLTGYEVSQTIQVKVRDLAKAGALLTSIGSLGVQNVNGLSFSVDEPTSIQAQAREKAINAAKAKADVLAKQLGVRLIRIMSFSESNGGYPRPMVFNAYGKGAADMAQPAAAPEVPTGEQKYTSNVNLTYEIR